MPKIKLEDIEVKLETIDVKLGKDDIATSSSKATIPKVLEKRASPIVRGEIKSSSSKTIRSRVDDEASEKDMPPSKRLKKTNLASQSSEEGGGQMAVSEEQLLQVETNKTREDPVRQPKKSRGESPGNHTTGVPYIDIDNDEQKLAAYFGYSDVAHLRALAMSYHVLWVYHSFKYIARNLSKEPTLRLLDDEELTFHNVVDRNSKWPVFGIFKDADPENIVRHLACILVNLKWDLEKLKSDTAQNNGELQKRLHTFSGSILLRENSGNIVSIPNINFEPTAATDPSKAFCNVDFLLGPVLPHENKIETFNRLWNLLRYIRDTLQSNTWVEKFGPEAMLVSIPVDASHIPAWLRPPHREATESSTLVVPGNRENPVSESVGDPLRGSVTVSDANIRPGLGLIAREVLPPSSKERPKDILEQGKKMSLRNLKQEIDKAKTEKRRWRMRESLLREVLERRELGE
ncbi:hypothetical protein GLAREA_11722 [Glarea lozoyensis ATCC 20868]|uniref:Uncharacterized protein n=1 Tax=Glarea lozoyensis (strain ATCC 20868 / MF5171) TaxID=1116229 RepID=S3CZ65_GLAL2|nr:uncharacterized protein GLAREA_11722 [Glarea lozoyensis ATCC 20868]EPE25141.1 hypothetical protein GLAREA_11722 [Glarea lozoyensis ATCC 20868]